MSAGLAWVAQHLREAWSVEDGLAQIEGGLRVALEAERISVFVLEAGQQELRAILQHGLPRSTPIRLGLAQDKSVAGYVLATRRLVNISDAYDDDELAAFDPPLTHLRAVDERTGFRTRQLLAAPLIAPGSGEAVGVIEVLNHDRNKRFSESCERELQALCAIVASLLEHAAASSRQTLDRLGNEQARLMMEMVALRAEAEGSFRQDAPEAAARARERILHMHWRQHANNSHLDVFEPNLSPRDPWTAGDYETLGWLCRLAESGHVGAKRLVDHSLDAGYYDNWSGFTLRQRIVVDGLAGARIRALAHRYPRVAQSIVMLEWERGDNADLQVVIAWSQLAGPEFASLAAALPDLCPDSRRIPSAVAAVFRRKGFEPAYRDPEPKRTAEFLEKIASRRAEAPGSRPEDSPGYFTENRFV